MNLRRNLPYLISVFLLLLSGCDRIQDPEINLFDGERAYDLIVEQLEFGPRIPGTQAHSDVGDFIVDELELLGWDVLEQDFEVDGQVGRNIVAHQDRGGTEWIIIGAHYDTRPLADRDPDTPESPVPGANDGASGVAVLLELARVLRREPVDQDVSLVFFDLEDSGGIEGKDWIIGSTYFVSALMLFPDEVVIVDMVGDADLNLYFEGNSDQAIAEEIWAVAQELEYDNFIPEFKYSLLDDHTPFVRKGIPAVDIIDFDYPAWHTTGDTLELVSAESLEKVGRTLQTWLSRK
jgi:hypothetical protein